MTNDTSGEINRGLSSALGFAIALGIFLIVLGIIAIARPFFATIAATLFLGTILLITGIFQIVHSFQTNIRGNFWLKFISGLIYCVGGLLIMFNPLPSLIALTVVVGISILVSSIFQVILAFELRPARNWDWVLLSGILGIILGILIWHGWPENSPWAIGLLLGINLVFDGLWMILFSASARKSLRV
ncbi:hypothetical protein NIES2119_29755 [[Phormidium ambiguum] IAM M-71]|uniref:HdeD protein n=1 Tax=[Phormidium ambiguum] IAM M-71 TaxID=454136 RepID=A0A1U7I484_9CYAN|nr:HdeD family acid-resistance protein [Phormidium ambiguum]OKH30983.1 hypothetical protein NIES2119_29755 [Phormidium ambiguum IAM M-71]